jgi:hypothetical protein
VFNNDDSWNGLSVRYRIAYPLTLLLTPALQEKLNMFFRYFFPIRHIQYELSQVWLHLTRKAKGGLLFSEAGQRSSSKVIMSKELRQILMIHN